jgi:GntR family transcriptional regulator
VNQRQRQKTLKTDAPGEEREIPGEVGHQLHYLGGQRGVGDKYTSQTGVLIGFGRTKVQVFFPDSGEVVPIDAAKLRIRHDLPLENVEALGLPGVRRSQDPSAETGAYTELITETLRAIIRKAPPGSKLSSELELADRFDVARNTVRDAYLQLIHDGLVIRRPHKGYYVRDELPITWPMSSRDSTSMLHSSPVDPWLRVITEAGYQGKQIIRVRIVNGDERIGRYTLGALMTEPDRTTPIQRAVVRDRIRLIEADGKWVPQELARSYYPYDIAHGTPILDEADIQPSIYHLLEEKGHIQMPSQDRVRARLGDDQERRALAVEGVLPLLEMVRAVPFTPHGRILLVRHSVMVGGPDKEFVWGVEA